MIVFCRHIFLVILFPFLFDDGYFFFGVRKSCWCGSAVRRCQFTCSNGEAPTSNPRYVAKSNGCGVPGMKMPILPDYISSAKLEQCCSSHDICYGTCNADKEDCDWKFRTCLYGICSDFEESIEKKQVHGCQYIAKTMFAAVEIMGCKYYLEAQEEACVCGRTSDNSDL